MDSTPERPPASGLAAGIGLGGSLACGLLATTAARWAAESYAELEGTGAWDRSGSVADATLTLAAATTALLAGWLALLLCCGALAVAPGRHAVPFRGWLRARSPSATRVAALLLALGAATTLPASARPTDGAPVRATVQVLDMPRNATVQPILTAPTPPEPAWPPTDPAPVGGKTVSRAGGNEAGAEVRAEVRAGAHEAGAVAQEAGVVVQAGDTLWGIAARRLGPDASAAAIAAEWPRWYAANRAVIGPDPDVILPGQQLRPPASPIPPSEGCEQ